MANPVRKKKKKQKEPFVTTARVASGREKVLTSSDRLPLVVEASLDVLARQRAASEPLDRVVAAVARERHLGPRERRAVADACFSFFRHRQAVEKLLDDALTKERGVVPRRRLLDLAGVALCSVAAGVDVDERVRAALPDYLRATVDDAALVGLQLPAALPPWLVQKLEEAWGAQTKQLVESLATHAPPVLCVDVRSCSVDDVIAALTTLGLRAERSSAAPTAVRVVAGRLSLGKLPPAIRAHVWPMDDGSQAVAHFVEAKAGEHVLDLCAGGGGKARLLSTTGAHVTAVDVDAGRLLRSLPKGVQGVVADGTRAPLRPHSFDRVLVDVPCSGTGTLRRAPDLAQRLAPDDLPPLIETQQQLLRAALSLVKPGGVVVYATCSLLKEENEGVVDVVAGAGAKKVREQRWTPPLTDGFYAAALRA